MCLVGWEHAFSKMHFMPLYLPTGYPLYSEWWKMRWEGSTSFDIKYHISSFRIDSALINHLNVAECSRDIVFRFWNAKMIEEVLFFSSDDWIQQRHYRIVVVLQCKPLWAFMKHLKNRNTRPLCVSSNTHLSDFSAVEMMPLVDRALKISSLGWPRSYYCSRQLQCDWTRHNCTLRPFA